MRKGASTAAAATRTGSERRTKFAFSWLANRTGALGNRLDTTATKRTGIRRTPWVGARATQDENMDYEWFAEGGADHVPE